MLEMRRTTESKCMGSMADAGPLSWSVLAQRDERGRGR
jgi:hypothetical protein